MNVNNQLNLNLNQTRIAHQNRNGRYATRSSRATEFAELISERASLTIRSNGTLQIFEKRKIPKLVKETSVKIIKSEVAL